VRRRAALLAVTLIATAACHADAPPPRDMSREEVARVLARLPVTPGLWETRSAVTDAIGPNLPVEVRRRLIGPRPDVRHCVTAAEAARPAAHFLATPAGRDCRFRDVALDGDRLTGTTICSGPDGPVVTRMSGAYRPTRYAARLDIAQRLPDGAVLTLKVTSEGRRVADCADREGAPAR
jgi:hypothetical protein